MNQVYAQAPTTPTGQKTVSKNQNPKRIIRSFNLGLNSVVRNIADDFGFFMNLPKPLSSSAFIKDNDTEECSNISCKRSLPETPLYDLDFGSDEDEDDIKRLKK